ncbi:hypothetical protein BDR06DRAFT_948746 [Suillus hirtellus]|nr:hypothetical protein BDR06DRAFT_948746 [Suillus hirtellus]
MFNVHSGLRIHVSQSRKKRCGEYHYSDTWSYDSGTHKFSLVLAPPHLCLTLIINIVIVICALGSVSLRARPFPSAAFPRSTPSADNSTSEVVFTVSECSLLAA